jgi:hypothetical protein
MRIRPVIVGVVFTVLVIIAGLLTFGQPATAQSKVADTASTWVLSKSGFTVERVLVGGACVVIVSRSAEAVDVVPCNP